MLVVPFPIEPRQNINKLGTCEHMQKMMLIIAIQYVRIQCHSNLVSNIQPFSNDQRIGRQGAVIYILHKIVRASSLWRKAWTHVKNKSL